jgi:glucose-6-phosphate dehydrogenase assembly protein OpcA
MATNYKVLGQVADASANDVTLYTVPSSTETIISTIAIANREAAENTFRIAIKVNGGSVANEDYINYDTTVGANDSIYLTLGLTLDASDVISVGASDANVTFSVFGSEIT